MMKNNVKIEKGKYGPRAVLSGIWSKRTTKILQNHHVAEIELNDGKGWHGNDLGFLAEFPQLRSLIILHLRCPSVEPIHFLHELRILEVITYCKTEIRFSEFPKLKDCSLEWRPKAKSLFDCKTLKELFVNNYKGKSTAPFGRLVNLESLSILNAPIDDLHGLSALKKLRYLRLANLRCLKSLAGIEGLSKLEELNINTCRRMHSIKEIGCLPRLRRLCLNNCGEIDSLKPLAKLRGLELVSFYGSTNIVDGDLSPLLKQKNLADNVAFQNRRHYSHTSHELRGEEKVVISEKELMEYLSLSKPMD